MIIQYVNSKGVHFDLECDSICISNGNFHRHEWKVDAEALRVGERVKKFKKEPVVYDITLKLRGDLSERKALLDDLHDAAEYDIFAKTPGKIYFGDFHIGCYILASDTHKASDLSCRTEKDISIYCPYPFWIKEETYYIPPIDIEGEWELLEVPASLPNTNFTDCHYRLRAYGPFSSQWVGLNKLFFYINDNQVQVDYTCKNEYIELDTRDETIVLVDAATGSRTNIYHLQNFNLDTFKKIPPGENVLKYDRSYAIEITLFHERSEPKWNENAPDTHFFITTEDGRPIMTEDGYYIVGAHQKGGAT